MGRSTKQAWLEGPGDLEEADVEDVPVTGDTIRVRGLPAAYSNEAQSKSLKVINAANGDQVATMDQAVLEVLQFAHGCVDPAFTRGRGPHGVDTVRPGVQKSDCGNRPAVWREQGGARNPGRHLSSWRTT